MSTTSGNTGNLEFLVTPGITGNLLKFNWSSWNFLIDGTTTKESSQKFICSPVVWKVVMMVMYISYDRYIYLVNTITDPRL